MQTAWEWKWILIIAKMKLDETRELPSGTRNVTMCFTCCAQLRPLAVENIAYCPFKAILGNSDLWLVVQWTNATHLVVDAHLFAFVPSCALVCGSLYEVLTGLPESEMPYHFYTDQRFALVLLCLFLILPLSIPKEISIQKYIRLAPRCLYARLLYGLPVRFFC